MVRTLTRVDVICANALLLPTVHRHDAEIRTPEVPHPFTPFPAIYIAESICVCG